MYSLLLSVPPVSAEEDRGLPLAVDPDVCQRLVRHPHSGDPSQPLPFSLGSVCLAYDYLKIRNVVAARICSQAMIDVLTSADPSVIAYPVALQERDSHEPLAASYYFWIPQHLRDVIDWHRSEVSTHPETGRHSPTRLVLTQACEEAAPAIFQTRGIYFLVADSLRERLQEGGIRGIRFAPLEAVSNPYGWFELQEVQRQVRAHPEQPLLWCRWSDKLVGFRREQEALDVLEQCMHWHPDLQEVWKRRGKVLHHLGRLQEAQHAFEYALHLKPTLREHEGQLSAEEEWDLSLRRISLEYGAVLRERGFAEEALVVALAVLERWGESLVTSYELAATYEVLGRLTEALHMAEQGMALDMGGLARELLSLEGRVSMQLGKYEEAIRAYDRLIDKKRGSLATLQGNRQALLAAGRQEEALHVEQEIQEWERRREENLKRMP